MKCIKTGCNIQYNDKIYHGDLYFNVSNAGVPCFVLSGVPTNSDIIAGQYAMYAADAITNSLYFIKKCSSAGADYDCYFVDEIFVTKEFYEFLVEWEPNICQHIKHVEK